MAHLGSSKRRRQAQRSKRKKRTKKKRERISEEKLTRMKISKSLSKMSTTEKTSENMRKAEADMETMMTLQAMDQIDSHPRTKCLFSSHLYFPLSFYFLISSNF